LLVSEIGQVALDARVLLYPAGTPVQALPRVAIRPYPARYVRDAALKDGTPVTVRPIRPEDEPLIAQFHTTLSDESVYFRYFHYMNLNQRVSHERLTRICFNDYDRQMALVASVGGAILGVARFTRLRATTSAEFAMVVSDRCQRRGLGELLLRQLVDVARREGLEALTGDILPDNRPMIGLVRKVGFSAEEDRSEGTVKIYLPLR
jgi:acetyltransferase